MKRSSLISHLITIKASAKSKSNNTLLKNVKKESFDWIMDEVIATLLYEDYPEDTEVEFGDF